MTKKAFHFATKSLTSMKAEAKTLIILTPGFPVSESDSTCLPFLQIFLKSLNENYPELNIIVLAFQYPYRNDSYYWNGIEVICFNGRNRRKLYKLVLWSRILRRLKKINRRHNIIGLLSLWLNECAWIGSRFAKKNNLKHYCWLWGQDAKSCNKYVKKINPSGNELIALSDFLQMEFEKNYSIRPSLVIPPGIDSTLFPNKNLVRDIDVLGVGSLIPLKGYKIFLELIYVLKKSFPDIQAVLCGKGPEEQMLLLQSKRLGIDKNLSFTGELPYAEVLQLMCRSKIMLHPSAYEGFSGSCQEALFAGAHVISFCRAMNKEINHWHIVKNKEEMLLKSFEILNNSQVEFTSVADYPIGKTITDIMKLFGL